MTSTGVATHLWLTHFWCTQCSTEYCNVLMTWLRNLILWLIHCTICTAVRWHNVLYCVRYWVNTMWTKMVLIRFNWARCIRQNRSEHDMSWRRGWFVRRFKKWLARYNLSVRKSCTEWLWWYVNVGLRWRRGSRRILFARYKDVTGS